MVASPIASDIASIVQRNKQDIAVRELELKELERQQADTSPEPEQPLISGRRSKRTRESELESKPQDDNDGPGLYQQQRMLPPQPKPNMLNQEMAEAAAIKFKKNEKRIQKACAKIDNPGQATCCVIL